MTTDEMREYFAYLQASIDWHRDFWEWVEANG